MMQLTDQFQKMFTDLNEQLHGTPYEDSANNACQKAQSATTPTEVLQIFQKLGNSFASIGEGVYGRLAIQLQDFIQEHARIQHIALPVLGEPSSPGEVEGPPRKRRRVEEPVESVAMEVGKQATLPPPQQQPPRLSKILNVILPYLPAEERAKLLGTSKELLSSFFHSEVEPTLFPLLPDSEFLNLFKLVTGETLPSVDLFEQRDEAEKKGDAVTVIKITYELHRAFLKVQDLESEWNFFPPKVKELFEDLEGSEILSDVEDYKRVLRASRAHNLHCIARMSHGDLTWAVRGDGITSKYAFIEAGERVAKDLPQEKDRIGWLDDYEAWACGLKLTRLPTEVTNLNLWRLILNSGECGKRPRLPKQIGNLSMLRELELSFMNLSKDHEVVYTFKKLTWLNLTCDKISTISPKIKWLSDLTILCLTGNNIAQLPQEFGTLRNLRELYLNQNRFTSLPSQIGQLIKLEELFANDNELHTITPEIFPPALRWLFLEQNQIEEVPHKIGNLKSLERFEISDNLIRLLPTELATIDRLAKLGISNNFLTSLPQEIAEKPKLEIDDRDLTKQKSPPETVQGIV